MKQTSITFTGDIAFDKHMDHKWEDDELISEEVLSFFHESDHVVANVEGAVSRFQQDPNAHGKSALFHTIDPDAVIILKKIRADIWNINNNHVMDIGEKGLMDTLDNAAKCGVHTLGAGKNIKEASTPVYLPDAGGIGMFGLGYQGPEHGCRPAGDDHCGCMPWNDMDRIQKMIDEIKSHCRWCVIVCHGGEEFTALPSPYVRDRYRRFLDMGADIVVAHHPHVPMNYETFPGKAIFYSLGNFIFDTDYQRSQCYTDIGVLLKISFTEEDFSFEALGTRIRRDDERIVKCPLPDIFSDVQEEEYNKLIPLSVKAFFEATKRQFRFLFPDKTVEDEEWDDMFKDPKKMECMPPERIPGEISDYAYLYNYAKQADEGLWKQTALPGVKDYILYQIKFGK